MRNLNVPQKREAAIALVEGVSADQSEVQLLKSQVEFLRSVLRSLLIRSPSERKADLKTSLQELDRISSPIQLQATVDSFYCPNYFRTEPDVEYKIALASALYTYMKLRIPSYNNPTLKAISDQSLSVSDLLKDFIEE